MKMKSNNGAAPSITERMHNNRYIYSHIAEKGKAITHVLFNSTQHRFNIYISSLCRSTLNPLGNPRSAF